ncbi:MAG TPA: hypothetical protein VN828_12445 [Acidobacteriaceae bacterium]|nr:hypothetical protein [Acidobacteriaceae bacterium]
MPEPSPFRVLYRVFWLRVVDLEVLSPESDTQRLLGHIAAMLAGISVLFTAPLVLLGGGLAQPDLWTVEHLFLATTMTIVGLLAVLSWESSFPDRRDLLVLGPLPVRVRTVFLAKLSALAGVLSFAIASLNCFIGLVWPLFFSDPGTGVIGGLRAIGAYWATITAASIFIFCCVLCLQGAAALLLPWQLFLRLSSLLQVCAFTLLLGGYLLEPSLESIPALSAAANQGLLKHLPSYWFLGLFQQLNGSMQPVFVPLAARAWKGLIIAATLAFTLLLSAWFWRLQRAVEQPDILPGRSSVSRLPRFSNLVETAVVQFAVRSLLRSRQHRLLYAFYLCLGLAVSVFFTGIAQIRTAPHSQLPGAYLAGSLMILCFGLLGLRLVVTIPVALRANWIFQLTQIHAPVVYLKAVRRALFGLSVVPAWLLISAVLLSEFPKWTTLVHLLALWIVGSMLIDIALVSLPKLPFACSYLPGKAKLHLLFWGGVIAGIPTANQAGFLESWFLNSGLRSSILVAVLASSAIAVRQWTTRRGQRTERMIFQEEEALDLISLRLNS